MRQSDWGARATSDEVGGGITRRDALRRGTLAGLGLVWVTPQVASFTMTAQFAQSTSPVPETTVPGDSTTDPTTGNTTVESSTPSNETTQPEVEGTTVETIAPEVKGTTVETTQTTQAAAGGTHVVAGPGVKDEVLSDQLPFTGLPLEQLLPLAGGVIATGAAAVRMARERKHPEADTEE